MSRWSDVGAAVCLAFLGAGVGFLTAEPSPVREPGATTWWVADRGGDRLYGLDADLFLVEAISMRAPTRVAAAPDGGAYVVNAHAGTPRGEHRLRYVQPGGIVRWERSLGPVLDLSSDGLRAVLVQDSTDGAGDDLGSPARRRVLDVAPDGRIEELVRGDVTCAARRDGRIALGFACGRVQLWQAGAVSPLAEGDAGGPLRDLAPASGSGWWALTATLGGTGTGGVELTRLSAGLERLSSFRPGSAAASLVPDGRGGVWLPGPDPQVLLWRPGGRPRRFELPFSGVGRGAGLSAGGALLAAPGALLLLDAEGHPGPGQGGFDYLVDVSPGGRGS